MIPGKPPSMPPLGGAVDARPYAPPPPAATTGTSAALVAVLLAAGALLGGVVVFFVLTVGPDAPRPPPVVPASPPPEPVVIATPTVITRPPSVVIPPPPVSCDEVSCVINNYEGACCAKYNKHATDGRTVKAGDVPDALDRQMISDAVARVKSKVMACGDKSSAKGKVKMHVRVAPSGAIADVQVNTTPDPALGTCVAAAMRTLTFPKTQNGGSFGYPFIF